ncbi:tyrosine-type recombinase/integrase [Burkholderia multivorans]|uniref:tyrosine-type recombinase/integrase n=1 Tax=Burkholderia multivorans TaxID=87883 RepID=UPI0006C81FFF|nr:hypothetical protein WL27_27065 [Burkholderia multivorans]
MRETCSADELDSGLDDVRYAADGAFHAIEDLSEAAGRWVELYGYRGQTGATVPAIHMPRWASRITREIAGVRAERLQSISEPDARAEGVKFTAPAWKIKDEWIKARRKSGHLGVRFHDLRHSAASEMINAGIDLYTVAGVLGHKTTTSTKRYAHLVTDRLAEAVKKIGRS